MNAWITSLVKHARKLPACSMDGVPFSLFTAAHHRLLEGCSSVIPTKTTTPTTMGWCFAAAETIRLVTELVSMNSFASYEKQLIVIIVLALQVGSSTLLSPWIIVIIIISNWSWKEGISWRAKCQKFPWIGPGGAVTHLNLIGETFPLTLFFLHHVIMKRW